MHAHQIRLSCTKCKFCKTKSFVLQERPFFYLSEYFEAHREQYIGCLNALHEDTAAWEQWLIFFLQAVDAQGLPIGRFDY